jgi:hypothetical protein
MRNLYPTWVGVDRALVVRTETLVCAKRLNCLEGAELATSDRSQGDDVRE